jgi:hypothetical protein
VQVGGVEIIFTAEARRRGEKPGTYRKRTQRAQRNSELAANEREGHEKEGQSDYRR